MLVVIESVITNNVVAPPEYSKLSIAVLIPWMFQYLFEGKEEHFPLQVQLVQAHVSQTTHVCVVHCQQWRRKLTDEVICLLSLILI